MGYALAQAALERGHEVTLVSGPVSIPVPEGVTLLQVTTAQEMYLAVEQNIKGHEVAIFSAAVADYRPAMVSDVKIKKGAARLTLELERTQDILGSTRSVFGFKGVLIGFAAETDEVVRFATEKMQRKMCDMVVANNVGTPGIGFDSEMNEVILCAPGQAPQPLRRDTKVEIARYLIERAEEIAARKFGKKSPS
jgi:phosphopantothenoylcysteine synthetase/decarboxylase